MTSQPSPFAQQVYVLCQQIPKGKVATYKELAQQLNTKAYQAIGQALRCNPYAPKVPCHRVVSSSGNIGGFQGHTKGKPIQEKITMLKAEGVIIYNNTIDLSKFGHTFS